MDQLGDLTTGILTAHRSAMVIERDDLIRTLGSSGSNQYESNEAECGMRNADSLNF